MRSMPKYFLRNPDLRFWVCAVWSIWWRRIRGPGMTVNRLRADLTAIEHFCMCCQATYALLLRYEAEELYAYEAWEWGHELAWRNTGVYEIGGEPAYAFDSLRIKGFEYIIQSDGTL